VTSAWYDNPASQRVSLRLGYRQEGEQLIARRGEPTRHLRYRLTREAWQREHFDGIEIHALEPCLAMLGAA
jgi:RimJ/RimL family protein N-acetyltransferase